MTDNKTEEAPPPPPPPDTEENGDSAKAQTPEPTLKLHGRWTLWFDNPKLAPPGSDWKDNLKQLATFDNIPDFWKVFNNCLPPSMITVSSNYSIFREGIEPTWEHASNVDGGKFVMTLAKPAVKEDRYNHNNPQGGKGGNNNNNSSDTQHQIAKLDETWLFTILAVLGETMDADGDQVCGAVVSVRGKQDRIALWLKTGDQETCVRIGERWKKVLGLEKTTLRYQMHKDAAASGRSFRNDVHFEV